MKERAILMNGAMVRAILCGSKWQTRRIVKPQPEGWNPQIESDGETWAWCLQGDTDYSEQIRCPYGGVGDQLWVRETWRPNWSEAARDMVVEYRAGGEFAPGQARTGGEKEPASWALTCLASEGGTVHWRPSIHMPRWASRITLEVTQVRVERLQDITEADAEVEGVEKEFRTVVMDPEGYKDYHIPNSYRGGFANLWAGLHPNGAYSWEANPFVWCIEYKQVQS